MIHYGMGRHADELPSANVTKIAKLLMAFECVYCTTVGIIKVSILLMYARIFPTRNFRLAAIILGGIAVGWVLAIICVSVFQCDPIAKAWNPTLPGSCINLKGSFIGNAVPNIVTDVAILSLPVHVVWGLHASLTHRLSVITVFLLGSLYVSFHPNLQNLAHLHHPSILPTTSISRGDHRSGQRWHTLTRISRPQKQRRIHQRLPLLHALPIRARGHHLDARQGMHLVPDRVRKRDHLRLSADPAAAVRGALVHVREQRRRLGRAHHGHRGQGLRAAELRRRQPDPAAAWRAPVQAARVAGCQPAG
ncbi:hypothetical protein BO86DRAFT_388091 [Aspergillus japonicus CBS 114.51]|uniref:Rhodopsin domain-containing protein n=1 Tax=Aspergillus japonicus CBS 114.51 TaxID=1448312 RepID=A0A8T8X5I8_ASPJA|nr:hypothetical protein BO86DRAFT_388091 [Aspergillus japonicus CBS 114.51]RAH83220.1 hypothetical protein BO86DRAFT_388091 [Aspergillus japonicus CBS 114.51]